MALAKCRAWFFHHAKCLHSHEQYKRWIFRKLIDWAHGSNGIHERWVNNEQFKFEARCTKVAIIWTNTSVCNENGHRMLYQPWQCSQHVQLRAYVRIECQMWKIRIVCWSKMHTNRALFTVQLIRKNRPSGATMHFHMSAAFLFVCWNWISMNKFKCLSDKSAKACRPEEAGSVVLVSALAFYQTVVWHFKNTMANLVSIYASQNKAKKLKIMSTDLLKVKFMKLYQNARLSPIKTWLLLC